MGQLKPDNIGRGRSIALDTVGIVYFLEKHPIHFLPAARLFNRLEAGEIFGIMSTLVFAELLVPAYRNDKKKLADAIQRVLSNFPNLTLLPVTVEISRSAAELRARHNLRTPDAIHVATALAGNADYFVTNDRQLSRLQRSGILKVLLFG